MASRKPSELTAISTPVAADIFVVEQADGTVYQQSRTGVLTKTVTNSITAGTTQTQAGATALTTFINRVTTVAVANDGVALPTAVAGMEILIVNDAAANALQVWPASGDAIDGGAVDAVDGNTLASGSARRYIAVDGTNWYTASGAGAAASEPYVTIGNTAGLSAERALTAGTGISVTDGGANSTVTIAVDAELAALAGLTSAADRLPYFTGAGTADVAVFTAAGRALVDDATAAAQRTTLGLAIGSDVQAYDAELAALAGLTSAADALPYFTGAGTAATTTFTAAGRALVDDATAAAQRATLGAAALGANTFAGEQNLADNLLTRPAIKDYGETVNAIGSIGGGSQDIDLTLGNVVTGTVDTSETTFTFSNPPASGTAGSFTLILTNGGSQTVNWPASVDWAGGTAPVLTAAGVDVVTFVTVDAGTIWYGFAAGLSMS